MKKKTIIRGAYIGYKLWKSKVYCKKKKNPTTHYFFGKSEQDFIFINKESYVDGLTYCK